MTRKTVLIWVALALVFMSPAWSVENVRVTAKAFPEKATLGDEIRLVVQVERPRKYFVQTPPASLKLSPFEVKRVEVSPVHRGENRVQETFTVVLTVFELGKLTIPSFPVEYRSDTGRSGQVATETIPIEVVSVGKKATDKEDIRPIKGPASFDLGYIRDWLCGALAVCLTIFLTVKVLLRRRRQKIDPENLLPADDRARLEMERLKKKGLLQERKTKEFYSELSTILRRYFERQYLMLALELTSEELVRQLKAKEFSQSSVEKVREVLEACDLVKFAKYEPPQALAASLEAKLLDILIETKPETVA